jgi:hypothetical protein
MVKDRERVTIEIDPNSELGRALRAADEPEAVRIEHDADDDAEAFRASLRASAGIFTPEEAEQLKQNIYRWREEGTRPIDRPGRND